MQDQDYDEQRKMQRFPAQQARGPRDKAQQMMSQADCTRIPAHVVRLARKTKNMPPVEEQGTTPVRIVSQFFSNLLR